MADWTPTSLIAVDMPGTAEWANTVQDNPVAIAEGAVGAPRVQSGAFQMVAGSASGSLLLPLIGSLTTSSGGSNKFLSLADGTIRITSTASSGVISIRVDGSIIGGSVSGAINVVLSVPRLGVIDFASSSAGTITNLGFRTTVPMTSLIPWPY